MFRRLVTVILGALVFGLGLATILPNGLLSDSGTKKAREAANTCLIAGSLPLVIGGATMVALGDFWAVVPGLIGQAWCLYRIDGPLNRE